MKNNTTSSLLDGALGTVNSSGEILTTEKEILTILLAGGELRGMYNFAGHAGDFEMLTANQVAAEKKRRLMEIGRYPAVPQAVVKRLIDTGFIEIPPKEGPSNRIARAKILRNLHLVGSGT